MARSPEYAVVYRAGVTKDADDVDDPFWNVPANGGGAGFVTDGGYAIVCLEQEESSIEDCENFVPRLRALEGVIGVFRLDLNDGDYDVFTLRLLPFLRAIEALYAAAEPLYAAVDAALVGLSEHTRSEWRTAALSLAEEYFRSIPMSRLG